MGKAIGHPAQSYAARNRSGLECLERRQLLSAALGTWTINGSDTANSILIDYKPGGLDQPRRLRAIIDGEVVSTRSVRGLELIEVFGGAGNDRIVFDLPNSGLSPDLQVWA